MLFPPLRLKDFLDGIAQDLLDVRADPRGIKLISGERQRVKNGRAGGDHVSVAFLRLPELFQAEPTELGDFPVAMNGKYQYSAGKLEPSEQPEDFVVDVRALILLKRPIDPAFVARVSRWRRLACMSLPDGAKHLCDRETPFEHIIFGVSRTGVLPWTFHVDALGCRHARRRYPNACGPILLISEVLLSSLSPSSSLLRPINSPRQG